LCLNEILAYVGVSNFFWGHQLPIATRYKISVWGDHSPLHVKFLACEDHSPTRMWFLIYSWFNKLLKCNISIFNVIGFAIWKILNEFRRQNLINIYSPFINSCHLENACSDYCWWTVIAVSLFSLNNSSVFFYFEIIRRANIMFLLNISSLSCIFDSNTQLLVSENIYI